MSNTIGGGEAQSGNQWISTIISDKWVGVYVKYFYRYTYAHIKVLPFFISKKDSYQSINIYVLVDLNVKKNSKGD